MKNIAVILAAGSGSRAGEGLPKQFRTLPDGRTVMETCLAPFEQCDAVDSILLVVHPDFIALAQQLMLACGWQKVRSIVTGGATRVESSWLALQALRDEPEPANVLIHDCARPFVSPRIIIDVCRALEENEAVSVAIPCTDTIYETNGTKPFFLHNIPPRNTLFRAQTPQAFRLHRLREAYTKTMSQASGTSLFTDDAGVFRTAFPEIRICLVDGEEANRKITFQEDLL